MTNSWRCCCSSQEDLIWIHGKTKQTVTEKLTGISDGIKCFHSIQIVTGTWNTCTHRLLSARAWKLFMWIASGVVRVMCVFVCSSYQTVLSALTGHHLETADEAQSGFSGPGSAWLQFLVSAPGTKTQFFSTNTKNIRTHLHYNSVRLTFGALWPRSTCGPLRDFMASRIICLLTKMNSKTKIWKKVKC